MRTTKWMIGALVGVLWVGTAVDSVFAGGRGRARPPARRPAARRMNQSHRIKSGVKDHSLTPREARRLGREQMRIDRERKKMEADGKLGPVERKRLDKMEDQASRHIFKERHDKEGQMGPTLHWKVWDPGVNQRQSFQRYRVGRGIESGSLTRDEVKEIAQAERALGKLEHEYKSDGVLTVEERKDLHEQLDELSQQIFAEKHDAENRPKLRPALAKKLDEKSFTGAEAKELVAQMKRVLELKRILGGPKKISATKRKELEAELDYLANNLFL